MDKSKTKPNDYIKSLPDESQEEIFELHKMISKIAKDQEIVMYEGKFWGGSEQQIIGYGNWSYTRSDKKKVEWFKVGLALQKNYITVYVNAVEDGKYVAESYKEKLGKAKVGKSSISFKNIKDVNIEILEEIISKGLQ